MKKNDKTKSKRNDIHLIDKKQYNDFIPDKVDFSIHTKYINSYLIKDHFKRMYSINSIRPVKRFKKIKSKSIKGGGIIFSTTISLNFNRRARQHLKNKYSIQRTASIVSNNNNFIPLLYKIKMKNDNYSFCQLRMHLYDLLWTLLESYIKTFKESISECFKDPCQVPVIELSFMHVSISLDLNFPHGVEFLKSNYIREKLNSVSSDLNPLIYKDNQSNTMLETKSVQDFIDPHRRGLKGKIDKDGSIINCYFKEESKYGDQVRIENKMDNDIVKDKFGSTVIKSKEDLIKKLESAGEEWSNLVFNTLQTKHKSPKLTRKKAILKLCRHYFPRESHRVFKNLYYPPYTICTGKDSISPSSVFRKVRLLAGNKKFFKQKHRTYYCIDNAWLEKYIRREIDL